MKEPGFFETPKGNRCVPPHYSNFHYYPKSGHSSRFESGTPVQEVAEDKSMTLEEYAKKQLENQGVDFQRFYNDIGYYFDVVFNFTGEHKNISLENLDFYKPDLSSWFAREPDRCLKAIEDRLDLSKKDFSKETGRFLSFLRNFFLGLFEDELDELDVYEVGEYLGKADPNELDRIQYVTKKFKEILSNKISEREGNYLLNARLMEIFDSITAEELDYEKGEDRLFLIAPDIYAIRVDSGLLRITKEENISKFGHQDSESKEYKNNLDLYTTNLNIEGYEGDASDFVFLQTRAMRELIQSDFGFVLADLTIREQFYFLNYLKNILVTDVALLKSFVKNYGIDGLRAFLSLERGDETLGDHIVAFGQHDEVAGTVFKYYGELLNSAERAEALVREVSDCDGSACVELANQVRENILNRAQKDLEKAVRAHDPSEVAAQIENYAADAKEYVAILQEIGAGIIESVPPESLTEEDQSRMRNLLHANYRKSYPRQEDVQFKAEVAKSLENSFSNPNTIFRILRHNGKIVSYNRFDTLSDYTGKEVSYFGSFNADPAYSGVGGVMLEETIKDRLEDGRPMMAHCDPTQAITKKYIEDGFVATGFYELAGKPSFEIWRSKDSTTKLESKKKSIEELLAPTGQTGEITVREQSEIETYPELKNNMGLTRYFIHQGKEYVVFEQLPENLRSDFTPPKKDLKKVA